MLVQEAIQSVEISTIAHATEDPTKVENALQNLLLGIHQSFIRWSWKATDGNPIVKIEAKLTKKTAVQFANLFIIGNSEPRVRATFNSQVFQLHSDDEGNHLDIRVHK